MVTMSVALPRTRNVTVLPVPNAHLAYTSEGRRAELSRIRFTSAKRYMSIRSTEARALAVRVHTPSIRSATSTPAVPAPSTLKRLNVPAPRIHLVHLRLHAPPGEPCSYSDLHMLPHCIEPSQSMSPPRKRATVYASSQRINSHTRLAHAHPYIRRHRSTNLHQCIGACAKLSTPSIRVQLATQGRRRVDCASTTLALSHLGRHKRRGRCACSHVPPRSITRSDAHTVRRHPHPRHRHCARTRTRPARRFYMRAYNFLHLAIRAAPCISIVTRVPRARCHDGRAHARPPLPRQMDR
jgi:hypothetical protein